MSYIILMHHSYKKYSYSFEIRFEVGDIVEVLYDEDEDEEPEWYEATIIKKIEYVDDIRLVCCLFVYH